MAEVEKMSRQADRRRYALAVCLIMMALRLPVSLALRLAWPDADTNAVHSYLSIICRETALWLAPALALRPWRTRRIGEKVSAGMLTASAAVCGALTQVSLWAARMLLPAQPSAGLLMPQGAAEWLLAVLALAIVPAICEEAFFRGVVTVHLMDAMHPTAAFALGTVIFALMHGDPAGLIPHLTVSAGCTLAMMATGRVWVCMLAHMSYNAAALALTQAHGTPWLALAGVIPMIAVFVLARGMRWKQTRRRVSRTDAALLCAIVALEAAQYIVSAP